MAIKPELIEYIRSLVRGDREANDRAEEVLNAEGWDEFPRFINTLFFIAVERRFTAESDPAEIIALVASIRADFSRGGPALDPLAAENLVKAVFDPAIEWTDDLEMVGQIQAAVVYKILSTENLTDDELSDVLAEAAESAARPLN